MEQFTIRSTFSTAWSVYKKNVIVLTAFVIVLVLVSIVISSGGNVSPRSLLGEDLFSSGGAFIGLLYYPFVSIVSFGLVYTFLTGKGNNAIMDQIKTFLPSYPRLVGLFALYSVLAFLVGFVMTFIAGILLLGSYSGFSTLVNTEPLVNGSLNIPYASLLFLLIVPVVSFGSFFLVLTFIHAPYLIMEKHFRIFPALGQSARLFKQHFWSLIGLYILLGLLNFLGAIPYGLGLLITAPFTVVAVIAAYRALSSHLPAAPVSSKPTN